MQQTHDVLIVGSGLSGLSTAHFLAKQQAGLDIVILEKKTRPGGCIQTFKEDAIQAEWGPHGFLNNTAESLELLRDTGLDQKVQQAPLGNYLRFLCHKGKLVPLPQKPQALLATPLLSMWGKLRLLADLWKPPRNMNQTVAEWAAYRFGKGVLPMVDAAVTGTFAGDLNRLSIDAVMPGIRKLEKEHGSLLRGLIKKKKQKKTDAKGLPAMLNFPGGMEQLTSTLATDKNIIYDSSVSAISLHDDRWQVKAGDKTYEASLLVIALPVNQSLRLLTGLKTPPIDEIPAARLLNVVLAFTDRVKVPYGFGYLAPEREKRFAMGAMFSSHMFPDRIKPGNVLIEVLVGGRRHPERLELDDDEVIKNVLADISTLIDIPEKPWFAKVLRSEAGIPQLEMDHPALLAWREELEKEFGGLAICGFGWDGIGMNDMVKSAKKATQYLLSKAKTRQAPDVKPVYF